MPQAFQIFCKWTAHYDYITRAISEMWKYFNKKRNKKKKRNETRTLYITTLKQFDIKTTRRFHQNRLYFYVRNMLWIEMDVRLPASHFCSSWPKFELAFQSIIHAQSKTVKKGKTALPIQWAWACKIEQTKDRNSQSWQKMMRKIAIFQEREREKERALQFNHPLYKLLISTIMITLPLE